LIIDNINNYYLRTYWSVAPWQQRLSYRPPVTVVKSNPPPVQFISLQMATVQSAKHTGAYINNSFQSISNMLETCLNIIASCHVIVYQWNACKLLRINCTLTQYFATDFDTSPPPMHITVALFKQPKLRSFKCNPHFKMNEHINQGSKMV
jgi:hypothetical protein